MPCIRRYEKTPQPVREINPNPEGELRSGYRCLELETDYRTNMLPACLRIYRPVERQLKVRPLADVQTFHFSHRSIAKRHQSYRWAVSEDLGNPIYWPFGPLD